MDDRRLRSILPLVPVLVAVGETEHVTEAAELIGMPQPTVSRSLRRLEQLLGVSLLERHGRRVRLTSEAHTLLPSLRRALNELQEGVARVDAAQGRAAVTVAMAFQTSLGERFVPEVLRRMRAVRPEISFTLHQGSRATCLAELDSGRAALALVVDAPGLPSGTEAEALFDQPLIALVPEGDRLAGRAWLRVKDLAAASIVTLTPGFGLRDSLDAIFTGSGLTPTIAFEGEDLITLRGLVAAGLGVAVAPEQPRPPQGCVQVPIRHPLATRRMCAVTVAGESRPAVREVIELAAAVSRATPWPLDAR